jgi:hypothetical protein
MNLLQRYKNWTRKQYDRQLGRWDGDSKFSPNFKWNPFDIDNDWAYDLAGGRWREFVWGWQNVGYAWEAWSYWMRDLRYGYKIPYAFWSAVNDGYMLMYVYSWSQKKEK